MEGPPWAKRYTTASQGSEKQIPEILPRAAKQPPGRNGANAKPNAGGNGRHGIRQASRPGGRGVQHPKHNANRTRDHGMHQTWLPPRWRRCRFGWAWRALDPMPFRALLFLIPRHSFPCVDAARSARRRAWPKPACHPKSAARAARWRQRGPSPSCHHKATIWHLPGPGYRAHQR